MSFTAFPHIKEATVDAKIIRKNGAIEDLGTIAKMTFQQSFKDKILQFFKKIF
jgi:hypothetical protein